MGFEAFAADVQAYGWNVHGAELYEDGVLTGSFGDTESKFPVYSATKSVLSIAAGMAGEESPLRKACWIICPECMSPPCVLSRPRLTAP